MKKILATALVTVLTVAAFAQTDTTPITLTAKDSPIEEWQIDGGNIIPYDAFLQDQTSTTNATYGLHRRKVRKHIRKD